MIYFDNAATTPLCDEVVEVIESLSRECFGNPSSSHQLGQKAREILSYSRATIAAALSAPASAVVFTSGGSEANNWVIEAFASMMAEKGKPHGITSQIEHASVLQPFLRLRSRGHAVSFARPDESGVVTAEAVDKEITNDTGFVSLQLVNNELGTIQPVKEVVDCCRTHGILVHADATQAFGKIPVDFTDLGVHALTVSAHKVHGPKGTGALLIDPELMLDSLLVGGDQEYGYRAGTENVVGAAGFAKAVELASSLRHETDRIRKMRDCFESHISRMSGVVLNGDAANRVAHISNFSLRSHDIDSFITSCDASGLCLSSGSACHTGNPDPSHVLLAIGRSRSDAKNSVRVSLSRRNMQDEVDDAVSIISKILTDATSSGRLECSP